MRKIFYPLLFCLITPILTNAQGSEIGIQIGLSNYQGDINEVNYAILNEANLSLGLDYRYNLNQSFVAAANLSFGAISGDDQNFENRKDWDPNLSFKSNFFQVGLQFHWLPLNKRRMKVKDDTGKTFSGKDIASLKTNMMDMEGRMLTPFGNSFSTKDKDGNEVVYNQHGDRITLNDDKYVIDQAYNKRFTPYIFGGIGLSNFNPSVVGFSTDTRAPQEAEYSNLHLTVPFGGGLRYDFHPKISASLEGVMYYPFSDYIDGISLTRNPEDNDWFMFYGFKVHYKFQALKFEAY